MSEIIPKEVKQEKENPEPEQLDLDPNGDLILVVEGQNAKRFLVSSKILSLASPVFSKMINSNFHEGTQMKENNCPMISLHEDDSHAMMTMLGVFHYKEPDPEVPMTAKQLADLAIHCDKYDCVKTIKPWILTWFSNFQHELAEEEYGFLLLAAHFFRAAEKFSELSAKAQIKLSTSSFDKWDSLDILDFLPGGLRDGLAGQMRRTLCDMHKKLQSVEESLGNNKTYHVGEGMWCMECGRIHPLSAKKCHPCRNDDLIMKYCTPEHRIAEYFTTLRRSRLWPSVEPFQNCSAEDIALRISVARVNVNQHKCQGKIACPLILEMGQLVVSVDGILSKVKGLGLYPLHPEGTE